MLGDVYKRQLMEVVDLVVKQVVEVLLQDLKAVKVHLVQVDIHLLQQVVMEH